MLPKPADPKADAEGQAIVEKMSPDAVKRMMGDPDEEFGELVDQISGG